MLEDVVHEDTFEPRVRSVCLFELITFILHFSEDLSVDDECGRSSISEGAFGILNFGSDYS